MTTTLIIGGALLGGVVIGMVVFLNHVGGAAVQKTIEEEAARLRSQGYDGRGNQV